MKTVQMIIGGKWYKADRKILAEEIQAILDKPICEKCNGTGEMDTGGFTPWGAGINVTCDCVEGKRYE